MSKDNTPDTQPDPPSKPPSKPPLKPSPEPLGHFVLVYRRLPTRKLLRMDPCSCGNGQDHSRYE